MSSSGPPNARAGSTGRRVIVNTSALAAGNFWRIGAAFLVQVLIARQLGAAALGAYAVALAYLNVAQIITEAGLPGLLVRQISGRPALRKAWFLRVLSIQFVLSLLVWAGLALIGMVAAPDNSGSLLLVAGASLPLYALFVAAASIFEAGERMERILAAETVSNGVLVAGALVVLALDGGVAAILWVTVLAQGSAALVALLLLQRGRFLAEPQETVSLPWRATLRRAGPFFGLAFTDVLQQRSDLLLLSLFASPIVIGAYSAANSIVRVLIKLVNAFWRALFPTLVRLDDTSPTAFARLDGLALRFGASLLLPAATIGMVISAGVMGLIFGPGYTAAAAPLALLLWTAPLYLWEQRAVLLLVVARRPKGGLAVAVSQLVALLLFLPPLTLVYGAAGAALAGVVSGLVGAVCGGWMLARVRLPLRMASIWRPAGAAAVAGFLAAVLPLPWPWQALVGGAAYLLVGWLLRAFTAGDYTLLRDSMRGLEPPPLHSPDATGGSPP